MIITALQTPSLDAIVSVAHREGINLRHLGRVRAVLPSSPRLQILRRLLLTECVTRTLKNLVRQQLRLSAKNAVDAPKGTRLSAPEVVYEYLEPVLFYQIPVPRFLAPLQKDDKAFVTENRLVLDTRVSVVSSSLFTFDQPLSTSCPSWYAEFFLEKLPVRYLLNSFPDSETPSSPYCNPTSSQIITE